MSSSEFMNNTRCFERIDKLYTLWRNTKLKNKINRFTDDNGALHSADAIVIIRGQENDDPTCSRTTTLQIWLFGNQFNDILVVFCQDSVIVYARSDTVNHLKQIRNVQRKNEHISQNFSFLTYEENDEKTFGDIIVQIKQSYLGKTLGVLSQDTTKGTFSKQWQNYVNQQTFTTVDIGASIAYLLSIKDDQELITIVKEDGSKTDATDQTSTVIRKRTVTTGKYSNLQTEVSSPKESRSEHQKRLLRNVNERAEARLAICDDRVASEKSRRINNSYKSEGQLPQDPDIQDLKLYVDRRYETVIVPMSGVPAPFHISSIKNVSLTVEGEFIYLRINFFHTDGFSKQTDKGDVYIKELTYRASNRKQGGTISPSDNLSGVHKLILEIQKKYKDQEQQRKQMESVVKQASLVLNPSKTNPKLKDLYIRPLLINKKISGTLEAHTNGFRYTSVRGEKIDILYSNISHAFYQPCDNEMIILIHFHLKNAMLFGKRQQTDVQFYTEIGELTTDLRKYRTVHDRDDVPAERAERELRHKLKVAFQSFIDKVVQQKNFPFVFEKVLRERGFPGAPFRSMVLIIPTTSCVVQLTEWPSLIIELDGIELVHFERVDFQRKNFDMIFIMKDYSKKTQSIQSIPMNKLDPIKNWLTSCEICYTEGPKSLKWTELMKAIVVDPHGFFARGGWTFLEMNGDETQDQDAADDSDTDEDDYDPDEDDDEDEEEEEDEEREEDDDFKDEKSDSGTDEESGKSWSELEEEAREADAEILNYNSDGRNEKEQSSIISLKRPASSIPSNNKKKK